MSKRHRHNWETFLKSDETGGFIQCKEKGCGEMRFLPPKQMRNFKRLVRSGFKGTQIEVRVIAK